MLSFFRYTGLSLLWPLPWWSTGQGHAGSAAMAQGPSRSAACGIFPDRGTKPCPLHRQAGSQPLLHQGSMVHFCFIYAVGSLALIYILLIKLNCFGLWCVYKATQISWKGKWRNTNGRKCFIIIKISWQAATFSQSQCFNIICLLHKYGFFCFFISLLISKHVKWLGRNLTLFKK